jgi:hypothetical protein
MAKRLRRSFLTRVRKGSNPFNPKSLSSSVVEQWIENPFVSGSIPFLGKKINFYFLNLTLILFIKILG